jgi:hypothetical protein
MPDPECTDLLKRDYSRLKPLSKAGEGTPLRCIMADIPGARVKQMCFVLLTRRNNNPCQWLAATAGVATKRVT